MHETIRETYSSGLNVTVHKLLRAFHKEFVTVGLNIGREILIKGRVDLRGGAFEACAREPFKVVITARLDPRIHLVDLLDAEFAVLNSTMGGNRRMRGRETWRWWQARRRRDFLSLDSTLSRSFCIIVWL